MNSKYFVEDLRRFAEATPELFKKRAYLLAAEEISKYSLEELSKFSLVDFLKIPRIGKATASILNDILQFGKSSKVEEIALPRGCNLLQLRGVGISKARKLISQYHVFTIEELAVRLQQSPTPDEKLQKAITFYFQSLERHPWYVLAETIASITSLFQQHNIEIIPSGSFRRFSSTVGDLDFVVKDASPEVVCTLLQKSFSGLHIEASGAEKTLCTIPTIDNRQIHADFVCTTPSTFGAVLNYLTGSRDFNVSLRKIAKSHGVLLNEHGIFKDSVLVSHLPQEVDLFSYFDIPFVEPPKRQTSYEDISEIQFISEKDFRISVHCHTTLSDGELTPEEVFSISQAEKYSIIGISDHSAPNPSGVSSLRDYSLRLHPLRQLGCKIGLEAEVLLSGLPEFIQRDCKQYLDYIILSCHVQHDKDVISRLLSAIEVVSPLPVILGHITGRLLGRRAGAEISTLESFSSFKNVIIEINSQLDRLDPPSQLLRTWNGPVVISTDAHTKEHFSGYQQGIWQSWKGYVKLSQLQMAADLLTIPSK